MIKLTANGMLRANTPLQRHTKSYDLWVKREDLSCVPPGPPFSKARGVYRRVESRKEKIIGVLDTRHSQGGHAVARACELLKKKCWVFYPEYKYEPGYREPQEKAKELGAKLIGLPAGRSAILFHAARKQIEAVGGYMMPNALKLEESIEETCRECKNIPRDFDNVLISISSGTIAAGVIRGLGNQPNYLIHLGYSRSHEQVLRYLTETSKQSKLKITLIDEKYSYKDKARPGETPPWPCNEYYDLKAFRWWVAKGRKLFKGKTLFWNIG